MAMLLGAIVSSTDAAAVFSVLTASGTRLRRRVGLTLELESGLNDPMAVILTTAITAGIASGAAPSPLAVATDVLRELAIGAVAGYAIARAGRLLVIRVHLPAAGLYPAFTLALACLSFGLTTLLHGSGFLAVYVTGMTLGSGALPHAVGVRRVHDALGWLSQVLMFLLLGLLVFPSRLWQVAAVGLTLALFLAFFARPLVAMLCLAPSDTGGATRRTWAGWGCVVPCPSCSPPFRSWPTYAGRGCCSTSCSSSSSSVRWCPGRRCPGWRGCCAWNRGRRRRRPR
jgi:cell volume regulation protein A